MGKVSLTDVLELSVAERIQLVEDIWDSIAKATPITDAQREELDRRLADYRQNPQVGTPWETVKSRILGQK